MKFHTFPEAMENKLLEEFRKEWKVEIGQKETPDHTNDAKLKKPCVKVVKQEADSIKIPDEVLNDDDNLIKRTNNEDRKKKNIFQPFVIAEDLLQGNSASSTLTPDPARVKRKSELREELFIQKNKRLKLLSPESASKPARNDSLLDLLIADLVSLHEL